MSDSVQPANPWWHPDELLGPGPSAMLAFVLAVLVLTGGNLMTNATVTFFGQFPTTSFDWSYALAIALGGLVPALAGGFLARRAIITKGAAAWELMLGRAALVLAVVAIAYTLLLTLGVLIHQP